MNMSDFVNTINTLGLRVDLANPKNPILIRAFVFEPSKDMPIYYGRADFMEGEYVSMKWYKGGLPDYSLDPKHYIYCAWFYYVETGRILDRGVWINHIIPEARQRSRDDYNRKMEWRKLNPKVDRDGNLRKRRKLMGRSERAFGWDLLKEMVNRGEAA